MLAGAQLQHPGRTWHHGQCHPPQNHYLQQMSGQVLSRHPPLPKILLQESTCERLFGQQTPFALRALRRFPKYFLHPQPVPAQFEGPQLFLVLLTILQEPLWWSIPSGHWELTQSMSSSLFDDLEGLVLFLAAFPVAGLTASMKLFMKEVAIIIVLDEQSDIQ